MSRHLHELVICAPDGIAGTSTVTLDGEPLECESITLRCNADGSNTISAVIEFDPVMVKFNGLALVAGKIVRDKAPV